MNHEIGEIGVSVIVNYITLRYCRNDIHVHFHRYVRTQK
jgi:hypothetical protein